MKSVFVITIGPAGSGKSNIINSLKEYIKMHHNYIKTDNFKSGSIDDYIEKDDEYIKRIVDIITKDIISSETLLNYVIKNSEKKNAEYEIINYSTDENSKRGIDNLNDVTDKMTHVYMDIRNKYSGINDDNIQLWIKRRENIFFETTGYGSLDWLFTKDGYFNNPTTLRDYVIIVAYPYVKKQEILTRALHRFANRVKFFYDHYINQHNNYADSDNIQKYIDDIKNNLIIENIKAEPPRLPFIFFGQNPLSSSIERIQENIINIMGKCIKTNNVNKLKIDKFLVYDVNTRDTKLMIDIDCEIGNIGRKYCNNYIENNGDTDKFLKSLMENISMLCSSNRPYNGGSYYPIKYKNNKNNYEKLIYSCKDLILF